MRTRSASQAGRGTEGAHEEERVIAQLIEGEEPGRRRLLIDIREVGSISREARAFFSSEATSDRYVTALCLVAHSSIGRVLGNFFIKWNRPKPPTLH